MLRPDAQRSRSALELLAAQVGRPLGEVETPVAVVDLDKLEANLQDLQSYADSTDRAVAAHQDAQVARDRARQLASAPAADGCEDGRGRGLPGGGAPRILVHYPPFGADKWIASRGWQRRPGADGRGRRPRSRRRLAAALARRGARAELLVEVDVGLHRTGQTTAAGALALAQALARLPAVDVAGISCYPGHCRGDAATIRSRVEAVDALLRETRDAFAAAGVRCDRISGGSTPTRYSPTRPASMSCAPALCVARPQRGHS